MCKENQPCGGPDFNVTDAFTEEAKPVWQQLFNIAKKHNVPAGFYALTRNESTPETRNGVKGTKVGRTIVGFRHHNELTPEYFAVVATTLDEGLEAGLEIGAGLVFMNAITGRNQTTLSSKKVVE